jgi:hypothetical protein
MNSERLFLPILWFALICWAGLIYYQPYAILLPLLTGGIVEALRFSTRKQPVPTSPFPVEYICPHKRRHTIYAATLEDAPKAMAQFDCGCAVDKPQH